MPFGRPLLRYDRVESTMDTAASLARQGAGEGTCVVAGTQAAGRGRANRSWNAPPDTSLLCSVILRPVQSLAELTPMAILTADAIAKAVERTTDLHPDIKWPNDVLIHGRKVAGVLIQTINAGGALAMIVGFGVNVNIPPASLPDGATSLLRETGGNTDVDRFRAAVLQELECRYLALTRDGIEPFWKDVHRRLAMRGERVTVVEGNREITGRLRGIDTDGALLLDNAGTSIRVVSGDVVRGPRLAHPA